jgi:cell division protein FtsI (penicillin-binding protein 3)
MTFSIRMSIAYFCVFACFVALGARLVHVQVLAADSNRAAGSSQASSQQTLRAPRGEIRDRLGSPIAYSEWGFDLWAEKSRIGDAASAADALGSAMDAESSEILSRLTRPGPRVRLGRGLSIETAERVRALALGGLKLDDTWRRVYPLGAAAVHLTGVVGVDGIGLEGLEFAWNSGLAGRPGERRLARDGRGNRIDLLDGTDVPAMPGANLVLAIDRGLQRVLHEEMAREAERIEPEGGAAVIMDPNTGDVLAIVSWPTFEPAERGSASPEAARNRAVQDAIEPGSTFKPFVMAWALEHGVVRPGERFFGENGEWKAFARRTIRDSHPHGWLTIEQSIVVSSNIILGKVGRKLGRDRLYEGVRAFRFGEKTGARIPGEARGILGPRTSWSGHTVVTVAFGQALAVTPLQLATGYAALVNGGLRVRPRLIRQLVDEEGRVLREFAPAPPERVISERTSRWVRETLLRVVEDPRGTGNRARVEGLAVAGKTGTAQTYERDPETGGMRVSATQVNASFVGFAPADKPRVVCAVIWQKPKRSRFGGSSAAPVVARVFRRAFGELGM